MNFRLFALVSLVSAVCASGAAHADYVVWNDVETGATLSFPDTWKQINNQQPDDLITLSIPSSDDENAVCRLRAREDKRFIIYPNANRADVRDLHFTQQFWDQYTASYDNVNIVRQQDNGGLGRGFSSMLLVSFMAPPTEPAAQRAGVMAVTNYYDHVYVAECTSSLLSYRKFNDGFLSFFKSINFKKVYHELTIGDYRNFLNEWGTIDVLLPNGISRSVY